MAGRALEDGDVGAAPREVRRRRQPGHAGAHNQDFQGVTTRRRIMPICRQ
jgi:hypothetical protein